MKRKVLVLEDEESIRSFLVLNMKRGGYEVIEAETGEQALEKYRENQDLAVAILDVMLPGIDGYEVCRTMRAEGYQAGVIMLTARTQEADKVNGLMNGADDYVTKPFSSIELVARVDALYRRVSGSPFSEEDVIKSGPFKLNLRAREVLKNGRKIELTQIEYGLLKAFMQNIGKALSRDELLEMVWGHHYVGELKIVDVCASRSRMTRPSRAISLRCADTGICGKDKALALSKGDAVPLRYVPGSAETGNDNPLAPARQGRPRRRGAGSGKEVRQSRTSLGICIGALRCAAKRR